MGNSSLMTWRNGSLEFHTSIDDGGWAGFRPGDSGHYIYYCDVVN